MPRVTPSLPQANAIYITLKWSSLFKRTLIGRHGKYKAQVVKAFKTVLGFTLP